MSSADVEIEFTMTLSVGSDPIRGAVALPGGGRRDFWGWLELVEIVQEAVEHGGDASGAHLAGPSPAAWRP